MAGPCAVTPPSRTRTSRSGWSMSSWLMHGGAAPRWVQVRGNRWGKQPACQGEPRKDAGQRRVSRYDAELAKQVLFQLSYVPWSEAMLRRLAKPSKMSLQQEHG